MKITRDGKEIELTRDELYSAWNEQQHKWDCEYILESLMEYLDDLDEKEIEAITGNSELISDIAHQWRKYINNNNNGDFEYACFVDAYDFVTENK